MALFFWEYLFFFLEIYTFLYYANEESDDVIGGSLKQLCNTQSRISPEVLEQCSSNLVPEMYITRETE